MKDINVHYQEYIRELVGCQILVATLYSGIYMDGRVGCL